MTIRLYFNQHGVRPWSTDFGDQTTEQSFASVMTVGVGGITRCKKTDDPENQPSAWLEFENATLDVMAENALICAE